MKKKKIVMMGFMSRCPIAGVVWQQLHYLEGFRRLGYDVAYLEDSSTQPYNPRDMSVSDDCSYTADFTRALAQRFGFSWGFRASFLNPAVTFGMSAAEFDRTLEQADAVFNVCGAQELTGAVRKARCLVYLESDPGVEQIKLARGIQDTIDFLRSHHFHFSFGENLGRPGCPLPDFEGIRWRPTRQPVATDLWRTAGPPPGPFRVTSIANWETRGKDIVWKNKIYYWSKTFEFLKFSDLPRSVRSAQPLTWELATDMRADPASEALFRRQGWALTPPHAMSARIDPYREYIQASHAEWTVAKDQYIRLGTGWFSDRSACYLAAGRPVITQDTGFAPFVPVGRGLFAFRGIEEIQAALDRILSDPQGQSRAAFEIAREYFEAEKVCAAMASEIGL